MTLRDRISMIHAEIGGALGAIDAEAGERLEERILQARRVFLAGAGRSGLIIRAFAMRLMHLGLQVYVVGETTTPAIEAGDLLVIGSGSGETAGLLAMAEKARALRAAVALVTIHPGSSIGRQADLVVRLPGTTPKAAPKAQGQAGPPMSRPGPRPRAPQPQESIQPRASLFEQAMLLLFEAVVLGLMERRGYDPERMFVRHANLE